MPYYKKPTNHLAYDHLGETQRRVRQYRLATVGPELLDHLDTAYNNAIRLEAEFLDALEIYKKAEESLRLHNVNTFADDSIADAVFNEIYTRLEPLDLNNLAQHEVYEAVVTEHERKWLSKQKFGRLMRLAGYTRRSVRHGDKISQVWHSD